MNFTHDELYSDQTLDSMEISKKNNSNKSSTYCSQNSGDEADDEYCDTVINCGEDLFMELCEAWLAQHGSDILEKVLNKPIKKKGNVNKK